MSKRSGRVHTPEVIKAAAHPTRQTILRFLKEREHSTIELERRTGENRYNLYHHLQKLQEVGLIGSRLSDSRAKRYFLVNETETTDHFYVLDRKQLKDPRLLDRILVIMSKALGEDILERNHVESLVVMVQYREQALGRDPQGSAPP